MWVSMTVERWVKPSMCTCIYINMWRQNTEYAGDVVFSRARARSLSVHIRFLVQHLYLHQIQRTAASYSVLTHSHTQRRVRAHTHSLPGTERHMERVAFRADCGRSIRDGPFLSIELSKQASTCHNRTVLEREPGVVALGRGVGPARRVLVRPRRTVRGGLRPAPRLVEVGRHAGVEELSGAGDLTT